MIEEIYDRNASLSIYQKKNFIYLYVWSADCNSAIYSESQYMILSGGQYCAEGGEKFLGK